MRPTTIHSPRLCARLGKIPGRWQLLSLTSFVILVCRMHPIPAQPLHSRGGLAVTGGLSILEWMYLDRYQRCAGVLPT